MLHIRPFQKDDWNMLLDIANQAVPFARQENAEWLEKRKAFAESQFIRRHYIAAIDEIPVGYGCLEQQNADPRSLRVYIVCSPENLAGEVGDQLYKKVLQDAKTLAATHLWVREYQKDQSIRAFFTKRGFAEGQRYTLPNQIPMVVYSLDLAANSDHDLKDSR